MSSDNKLQEILAETFRYGVGTNSEDIKGNETAYINLQKHAIEEAEAAIKSYIQDEIIGEDEDELEPATLRKLEMFNPKISRNQLRANQRSELMGEKT